MESTYTIYIAYSIQHGIEEPCFSHAEALDVRDQCVRLAAYRNVPIFISAIDITETKLRETIIL